MSDIDASPESGNSGDELESAHSHSRAKQWLVFWLLVVGAVALDWWSKSAAVAYHVRENGLLAEKMPAPLFDAGIFNLQIVREYNTGMAFGLLQDTPNSWLYLGAIRALAVAVLIWLFHRPVRRSRWVQWSIGAVAAGAAGNLLDNVFHLEIGHEHSVRDFLLLTVSNASLPAFNLADVYVTVGALAFVVVLSRTRST